MDDKRKKRQEELAKIFYEMGMDNDLVAKISGLSSEEVGSITKKQVNTVDNSLEKSYNNEAK